MRLNLFSSDSLHPDFLSVDKWQPPNATPENFLKADLSKRWPWEDSTIEEIRAHDGPEHLKEKAHFMNEAWRVLQPRGILEIFVPTTDGRGAFQDPTHVSFWTPNDLFYFCGVFAEWIRFHEAYGIRANFAIPNASGALETWTAILQGHALYGPEDQKVWKLKVRLEACK